MDCIEAKGRRIRVINDFDGKNINTVIHSDL